MGPALPCVSAAQPLRPCRRYSSAMAAAVPSVDAALPPLFHRHGGRADVAVPLPAPAAVLRLEAGDHAVQVAQQLLDLRPPPLQPQVRHQVSVQRHKLITCLHRVDTQRFSHARQV